MAGSALRIEFEGRSAVHASGVFRIGHSGHCRLHTDDGRVAEEHALLTSTDQGWTLEDLGSSGGTWIHGQQITSCAIPYLVEVRLADPHDGPLLVLEPVELQPAPPPAPAAPARPATAAPVPAGMLTGSFVSRDHTRIGRAPDNDVVVDDLLVSRHHAELRRGPDGRLTLTDIGSRNGTFVNGRRVTRAELDDYDLVAIGHSAFRVVFGMLEEYVDTGEVSFEARGLTVAGPDGRTLLDDVTLSLDPCSLLAVVGPSGSGKSTLLAALSGLRPAPQGQVLYGQRDLYRDYDELRNRIGFVPQEDILHHELPMRQALAYAGRLRFPSEVTSTERTQRIDEVLEELGIAHRADAAIGELSGGERKRTSVALELMTRPSLLFLDEPASGLDPGITRVLMRLLRELADSGRTVVVVTHELENLPLCDRVLVLAPGGVPAYMGPPEDAAAHFGRDDMTDVFSDLSSNPAAEWRQTVAPVDDRVPDPPPTTVATAPPVRQQGWLAQFRTLCARYTAVLLADRRNVAVLAAQAPVLGILMLIALPAGELSTPALPEVRLVSTAGLVLFVVLLGATWIGANNAIREIARELPILRRERSVGLSLSAYVGSKVAVLGTLTIVQSIVLVAIATSRQRGPADAVVLGWPTGELMVVVALAGVASMTLALLVSAVAGSPDRATSILPMLLILQLVLSAGAVLPEIADRPVLREVGYASSAQWGVAAAASTVDLNRLQLFDQRLRDLRAVDASAPTPAVEALTAELSPNARYAHEPSSWLTSVAALLALIVLTTTGTVLALRRFDPGR